MCTSDHHEEMGEGPVRAAEGTEAHATEVLGEIEDAIAAGRSMGLGAWAIVGRVRRIVVPAPADAGHAHHGRGTPGDGPDDPDCPCRGTPTEAECAGAGCGFCVAPADAGGEVGRAVRELSRFASCLPGCAALVDPEEHGCTCGYASAWNAVFSRPARTPPAGEVGREVWAAILRVRQAERQVGRWVALKNHEEKCSAMTERGLALDALWDALAAQAREAEGLRETLAAEKERADDTLRGVLGLQDERRALRARVAELEGAKSENPPPPAPIGAGGEARRIPLPSTLHANLTSWVVEPRHERGRADDARITLTSPDRKFLGTITVGWLREHTDLPAWEEAEAEVYAEGRAAETGGGE